VIHSRSFRSAVQHPNTATSQTMSGSFGHYRSVTCPLTTASDLASESSYRRGHELASDLDLTSEMRSEAALNDM
jgi:hypothetical protein